MESELKIKNFKKEEERKETDNEYLCKVKKKMETTKNQTYLNHTCLILHEIIYLISAVLNSWDDTLASLKWW